VVIDLSVFVTLSCDVAHHGDVDCDVFCILVKSCAYIYTHRIRYSDVAFIDRSKEFRSSAS
jgi:hypothetical protein